MAAESEEIAEDALRLIEVEYEPLPFVIDLEAALQPDAPQLHEEGNIARGAAKVYERGDRGRASPRPTSCVEHAYTTQAALHNCLEPHGCTAAWEGDQLTLWDSTQGIFAVRQEVAEKLGLPEHHVRVIKQHMGGGFGAKQIAWKHDVIAALLSKQAGRPVQLMLDREAENLAVGNRNPTRQHVRIGARRDGTLTAIAAEIEPGGGAYQAGGEASDVSGTYQTLYRCPNVRTEQIAGLHQHRSGGRVPRARPRGRRPSRSNQAMDELARAAGDGPGRAAAAQLLARRDQQEDKPYTSPESLRRCYDRVDRGVRLARRGTRQLRTGTEATRYRVRRARLGGRQPAIRPGYAWVEAQRRRQRRSGHRHAGYRHRHPHRAGPDRRRGARPADGAGGAPPGRHRDRPVCAGQLRQRDPGDASARPSAPPRPTPSGNCSTSPRTILEVAAGELPMRDGKIVVDGRAGARAVPIGEVTQQIAPHMIQGRGARGPNPEDKSDAHLRRAVRRGRGRHRDGRGDACCASSTSHDCGRIVNPTMVDSQVIGGDHAGRRLRADRGADRRSPARDGAERQPGGIQGADGRRHAADRARHGSTCPTWRRTRPARRESASRR